MFVLDTDHISVLERQSSECDRLISRMAMYSRLDFYASIVSFHERVLGWNALIQKAKSPQQIVMAYERFEGVLDDFAALQILPFDEAAAAVFTSLRQQRIRIGTMDLRIASSAISKGFTVLTRNVVDFEKVPGLSVEDWTSVEEPLDD